MILRFAEIGRSSAALLQWIASIGRQGEVGLAVVYSIRGVLCFDFEGVDKHNGADWFALRMHARVRIKDKRVSSAAETDW